MGDYFTLEELLTSSVARQKSIENLPSFVIVDNLRHLKDNLLNPLREDWGSGINVSSGFRCPKLNEAVGGVFNSCHRLGFAADIQPANGKMEEFKKFIVEWCKDKMFDEIILESNGKVEWVHIQEYSPNGFQRKKVFSLTA